jgi:hypothetical protein
MLGLPAGACANAGKVKAGKLNAAKATLETNKPPIRLLIFMIPDPPLRVLIGYWAAFSDCQCRVRQQIIALHLRLPRGCPLLYRSGDFPQVALLALCDFGRNVLIKSFFSASAAA